MIIGEQVFKIIYHTNFSNLKHATSFLHLLLTQDQKRQEVFHKVPIIGFQRVKILKIFFRKMKGFVEHLWDLSQQQHKGPTL